MNSERQLDLGRKGQLLVVPDPPSLFLAAAELFTQAAQGALRQQGRFTVALSGGSTPRALYELLAGKAWRDGVDWGKTHIFWSDERWVPSTDRNSNFRMTNEALLSKISIPAENVHRVKTDDGDPPRAAAEYERCVRQVLGDEARFDLILLGLGTNGHTASLFPHSAALGVTDRLVVADYVDEVKMYRITFTVPLINAARRVLFLLAGRDKAEVFRQVVRGPVDAQRLPAQLIAPTDGTLTWVADAAAAASVEGH